MRATPAPVKISSCSTFLAQEISAPHLRGALSKPSPTVAKISKRLYYHDKVSPNLSKIETSHVSCPLCPRILSPADASYMSCPSSHMFFPPADVSYIFAFLRKSWRPFFIKICNSSSLFTSSPSSTVCKVQILVF